MRIEPASGGVGATVDDVDVRAITDEEQQTIDAAWAEHGVLFFRGQELTPDEQLGFATRFAEVDINRFFASVDGEPAVATVLKEADQTTNIGGAWHTDHSYDPTPARGSVLYAVETPPAGMGDTMFADVGAALDALSPGMQSMLENLRAVHTNEDVFSAEYLAAGGMQGRIEHDASTCTSVHPVVIRHPQTGRRLLYVNPGFTRSFEGWTVEESRPLLQQLYEHVSKPDFTTRFSWEPGSMAMWDNRMTWHNAVNDYQGHRRLMHRVTIKGEPLTAAG